MTTTPALAPDEYFQKIAAATVLYYRQLDERPPLARELVDWLGHLTASVQRQLFGMGLQHCLALPDFLRYVLARRGHSLLAFMEAHLNAADFAGWMRQDNEAPAPRS